MRELRVLYDFQAFTWQKYGGVSNCFTQLIKNMPSEISYKIAIAESDNVHLRDAKITNVRPISLNGDNFLGRKFFPGKYRLYRYFTKLFPKLTTEGKNFMMAQRMLQSDDYDVFHPTFFNPYFLKYLHGKPYVLTVHDMIPELVYENHNDPQVANKKLLCKAAAHIVAVSERTKQDIMEVLKIPADRITVVYHACSDITPKVTDLNFQYLLYVGGRNLPYKNFIPMVRSLANVLRKHQNLFLVCTGADFSKAELSEFKKLGIEDRIKHIFCSDAELFGLYMKAQAFIFPSLYEGFGIPILEAYRSNCPVIINRTSCFPEICGDAAIYFDLYDGKNNLEPILEDFLSWPHEKRHSLIQRQRARLELYSWKSSAQKLADVYRKVANR